VNGTDESNTPEETNTATRLFTRKKIPMTPSPLRRTIKRWSIFPVVGFDVLAAVGSTAIAMKGDGGLQAVSWLGAAFATAALPIQIISFFALRKARTSRNLTLMTAIASVAMATTLVASFPEGTWWSVAVSILGLLSTQYYARWYSRLDRELQATLEVGARLPRFEVLDVDGTTVDSESFLGKATAFVFIRGNWCPLCVAQVRELAAQYQSLAARDIEVALISPQPLDETRALAERFGVSFRYLQDPSAKAASSLGLLHVRGVPPGVTALGYEADTVFPTVIVINESGTIVFSDQTDDYRLRAEPTLFIAALESARATSDES
jgi:peroxiredoxin